MTIENKSMLKTWLKVYERDEDRVDNLRTALRNLSANPVATDALVDALINAAKNTVKDLAIIKEEYGYDEDDVGYLLDALNEDLDGGDENLTTAAESDQRQD